MECKMKMVKYRVTTSQIFAHAWQTGETNEKSQKLILAVMQFYTTKIISICYVIRRLYLRNL